MPIIFIRLIDVAFTALEWLIVAHIILSWIPRNSQIVIQISHFVDSIVVPILRPLRKIVPVVNLGGAGLDLSALVALIMLQVLRPFVHNLLLYL